jgi:uncharacterized short protein YbdD (DUF466 family)
MTKRAEAEAILAATAKLYIGVVDYPKTGALRVWYVAKVPMKPFHVPVKTVTQAKMMLHILQDYDSHLEQAKLKPEWENSCGLEVYYAHSGWQEWHRASDSYSILDIMLNESLDNQ